MMWKVENQGSRSMQKLIRKYLLLIMMVAMIAILIFNYHSVGNTLINEKNRSFHNKMDQLISVMKSNDVELNTLTESLDEDYLTRARTFAYLIEKDSSVIKKEDEMNKILELLNVDELHVTDGDGIIRYSTVKKYIGLDFHDGEQTSGFLPLLDGSKQYVIQEVQPNTAEKKMMQYVGVARPDQKGIVQVGMTPARLLDAKRRNTYHYIFEHIPLDIGESLFAVDKSTGDILAHTNSQYNQLKNIKELNMTTDDFLSASVGKFIKIDGDNRYIYTSEYEGMILGIGISEKSVFETRMSETMTLAFYILIIYAISLIVLNGIINRFIIRGVHEIIDDLHDIQRGHLDKQIHVNITPEFEILSHDINDMLQDILNANVRLSQIIELTDLKIASFECRRDLNRVLVTSRLKDLLRFDDEEADILFHDKEKFLQAIYDICDHSVAQDVYQIDDNYYVRIHIVYENNEIFGTVEDITESYLKQSLLKYRSEHDGLTHLFTYHAFLKQINQQVVSGKQNVMAAMMIDLDEFKEVNDHYGHDFGDQYLVEFAKALETLPKTHTFISRRSGDEFCIFFYDFNNSQDILDLLNVFWNHMSSTYVLTEKKKKVYLKASGGLEWYSWQLSVTQLMKNADLQLYKAKKSQKGYFIVG